MNKKRKEFNLIIDEETITQAFTDVIDGYIGSGEPEPAAIAIVNSVLREFLECANAVD